MRRNHVVGILTGAVIGLTAITAIAAPTAAPVERPWLRSAAAPKEAPHSSDSYTLKGMALLAFVGVGGYLLWRHRRRVPGAVGAPSTAIKVRSLTRISARAQVVVLEVQGKTLLLGTTDTHITNLGWLDDELGLDSDLKDDDLEGPGGASLDRREPLPGRARDGALNTLKHTRYDHASQQEFAATSGKSSRFRELLADAIGLPPSRGTRPRSATSAPSDEVAASVRDRYVGRAVETKEAMRVGRENLSAPSLVNVEGQAKGLVARLNK